MQRKRLTEHAKQRNKERFGVANNRIKEIMSGGYTVANFTGEFYIYLHYVKHKRSGAINIKVKDDMMVIYNKRSQRAITVYKVPEKFLPIEKYLVEGVKR